MCEFQDNCPIYKHFRTQVLKNIYIKKYCEGNHEECLRKIKRKNDEAVPDNLLPDGKELSQFHLKG